MTEPGGRGRAEEPILAPPMAIALGSGLGIVVGVLVAGGPGIAFGAVAGAALGLVVGAAIAARRRD